MQKKKSALETACVNTLKEAALIGSILPCTAIIIFLSALMAKDILLYRIFLLCLMPPSWLLYWAYYCLAYITVAKEMQTWTFAAEKILFWKPEEYIEAIKKDGYAITVNRRQKYVRYIDDNGYPIYISYRFLPTYIKQK